jgi:hypothetical protein
MPPANGAVTITKTNKKPILLTLKCSHLDEMPTANVKVSKVSEVSEVSEVSKVSKVYLKIGASSSSVGRSWSETN